jgi:transmembrane protein EpsG
MTVYLVNIAFILFWGVMLLYANSSDQKKKIYCTIVTIQWVLISGLRGWSVGADTSAYYSKFENVKVTPWETVIDNCWDYLFNGLEIKDPGYDLAQKIFQVFFDDYQMWLVFIAVLFTGLMGRWIYKYSSMPDISFLMYSVVFFAFYSLTGHRQTIATALVTFLGYELVKKKKWIQLAIVTFIAFMIHKSSLVFIVYYVIANISITPVYFVAMIGATIAAGVLGTSLYAPIALALGFEEGAINDQGGGAETYAFVLLLLCAVSLILYPTVKAMRVDAKNLYNMLFLTMITTVLVFQNRNFMRIQQYFSLITMIFLPEFIRAIDKRYRIFAYLALVIFLIWYLMRTNPYYSFFFM